MTDKEKIASIAKAYANYLDPDNKCNRTMIEVDSIVFVEWLKEEFEIVSKEKIREEYNKTADWEGNLIKQVSHEANRCLLESLFPQTLKSEENG